MIYRGINIVRPFGKVLQKNLTPSRLVIAESHRNKSDAPDSGKCDEKAKTGSRANYEFHPETEAFLNQQVNAEFKAFYYYLSMAAYFGRVDVALPGCESFFKQMHQEEHDHAMQFIEYIKMRGGTIDLCPIDSPSDQNWKCPLDAFKTALQLEMEVTDRLVNANNVATKHADLNASDFIVTNFLDDQMKSINEIGKFVTILSGIGNEPLGRFIFDKDLLKNHVSREFNVLKGSISKQPEKK